MTYEEYNKKREEILKSFIGELDNASIVALHNEYCNLTNYLESIVYNNDEETFNEIIGVKSPFDLAMELDGVDYNTRNDYFTYGEAGLISFDNPIGDRSPICIGDILYTRSVESVIGLLDDANIRHWDLDDELEALDMEYKKGIFREQWDKMLASNAPMFTFPNGDNCYINYDEDEGTLETGSACNAGFCLGPRSVLINIDYDETLDYNLEGLYELMVDENPELNEEPEENEND